MNFDVTRRNHDYPVSPRCNPLNCTACSRPRLPSFALLRSRCWLGWPWVRWPRRWQLAALAQNPAVCSRSLGRDVLAAPPHQRLRRVVLCLHSLRTRKCLKIPSRHAQTPKPLPPGSHRIDPQSLSIQLSRSTNWRNFHEVHLCQGSRRHRRLNLLGRSICSILLCCRRSVLRWNAALLLVIGRN